MQRGHREPTQQTGRKTRGLGLDGRGLHDLFVAHACHRIGFFVHIDSYVDNPANIREVSVRHVAFLIKALLGSILERIFSFFPSLSVTPGELIQHSDFRTPPKSDIVCRTEKSVDSSSFPALSSSVANHLAFVRTFESIYKGQTGLRQGRISPVGSSLPQDALQAGA